MKAIAIPYLKEHISGKNIIFYNLNNNIKRRKPLEIRLEHKL